MKQLGLMLVVIMLFTACAPAPIPAPTPDINATVEAVTKKIVSETLTAQPSPTLVPTSTALPTETPTLIPTQTATPELAAASVTPTQSLAGDATSTPWTGTFDPGNTDGLPNAFFRIDNFSGVKGVLVTLNGITLTREQPIYYAFKVDGSQVSTIKWARYKYVIQIPNKRIFTGSVTINNKDKTTLSIYLTKITIVGP
jgi:hypothetical protein